MTTIGTDLDRAAELLREGELVAFATETVYGLGACAFDASAVAQVFEAKGRPTFDPLIVHLPDELPTETVAASQPESLAALEQNFWPGPLTVVLPKRSEVPDLVTSGLPTVAVRRPRATITRALLSKVGQPVAAPSANRFGQTSPTTAQHVADQLSGKVAYILDGGPCEVGIESTVLDLTGDMPVLLRPGGVPLEEIEAVIGPVRLPDPEAHSDDAPQVGPGMLSRHYAPRTPLYITDSPAPSMSQRVGLLTFKPLSSCQPFAETEVLSESGNLTEAATNFFAALRRLDQANLDCILATPFPEEGLGRALNDRLKRAAEPE